MLSRNRYGINNLLIQRLHRHAKLTTLFRPLDEPVQVYSRQPRTISRYEPAESDGIRPVQAFLIANPVPSEGRSLPLKVGRRDTAEKTSDDTDQANWRRLQAIFRAHEHKEGFSKESQLPGKEEQMKTAGVSPIQRNVAPTEPRPQTPVINSGAERSASGPGSQDVMQKPEYPGPQISNEVPASHQALMDAHEGETGQRIEFEPGTSNAASESEAGLEQSESELPPASGLQAQPLQSAWPVQPLPPDSMVKTKHEQNGEPAAMRGANREIQEEAHPDAPPVDNSTLQMVVEQTPSDKPSASSVEQISPRHPRPQPSSTTEVKSLAREEDEVMESDFEEQYIFTPEKDPYSVQGSEFPTENDLANESQHEVDAAANTQTKVSSRDLNYEQSRTTSRSEQQTSSAAESVSNELPKGVRSSKGKISDSQHDRPLRHHGPAEPSPADIQRQLEPPFGGSSGEPGRVETSPVDAGSTPQALIPTEVGPLPADLWDLLDQPRPSKEMTVPSSAIGSHFNKTGMPVQRQVEETGLENKWQTGTLSSQQAAVRPAPKPPLAPTSRVESEPGRKANPNDNANEKAGRSLPSQLLDLPAVSVENIQRKPDETGEAPRSGSETLSSTGSEAGGESDINLDELARRVYAEVRARLAVEWERLRR